MARTNEEQAAVTSTLLEVVTLSNSEGVHLSRFNFIGMEDWRVNVLVCCTSSSLV